MRDDALNESDMHVIKQVECNVAITTEFRDWRQELRDLPNGDSFPVTLPNTTIKCSWYYNSRRISNYIKIYSHD